MNRKNKINFQKILGGFIFFVISFAVFFPQIAGAVMYLPGETLEPACAPTSANCGVTSNIAAYFTATSTTATSTFAGGLAIETNGLVYDYSTNRVGIGTTSPYARLSVVGETVAEYFTATSTTATSTFAGGLSITGTGTGLNFGSDTLFYQNNQRFLTSSTTSAGNLTIGYQSATGLDANGGLYNTGVGYQALGNATSTNYNTALGYQALLGSATISNAGYNTAVGYQALNHNTTGISNIANGYSSLYLNTTGSFNIANGSFSLYSNTTGDSNVANGSSALRLNTTGSDNTANGMSSLYHNTTGTGSTVFGYNAGRGDGTTVDQRSVIDNYATFLGYQASRSESVASTSALTNITAIGKNARVGASNTIVLGGTGADAVNVGVGTTSPYARLSVVGQTVAEYFTATSTTATSTFPLLKTTTAFQLGSDYITDITGTGLSITDGVLSATGGSGANSKWGTTTDATGIYLNSTANVAIGTTSPWAKLSIQNTYGSQTPLFDVASSTSAAYATTSIFRVNADGKIGIGTTSPQTKLHIVDSSSQLRAGYDINNYFNISAVGNGSTTLTAKGSSPDLNIRTNGDFNVNSALLFNSLNRSLLLNMSSSTAQFEVAVPLGIQPDSVPLMTSNTAPSGIASVSDEYTPSYTAFKAFDDNTSSYWENAHYVTAGWLAYEFTTVMTITKYTITPALPLTTDRAPKSWTLEGWTGSEWVVLDTKSNITSWVAGVKKEFVVQNDTAYIKYRINISQSNGNPDWLAVGEMELSGYGAYQTAFQVATSGNVGIGTSTPNWKLQIATTSVPQFVLSDTGAGNNLKHWALRSSGGNLYFATSSDSYATSTISALMIDMNGNIGIGTTSPWRTLSVTGTMAATALTAGAAGDYAVCINNTTKEITNAGASGCVVSSKRFKENISELDSSLDELMKLKPSKFNYIGQSGEHIGLIAEDVDTVDKRLVEYEADGITPRTVRYMEMSALLIKAIQEQQLSIEQLKRTIASTTAFAVSATTDSGQSSGLVSQGFQWVIEQFQSVFGIVFGKGKIEADKIKAKEICVGDTCVTEEKFKAVFGSSDEAQGAQTGASAQAENFQSSSNSASNGSPSSSSSVGNSSSSETADGRSTAGAASSENSSLSSSSSAEATSSTSSEAVSSSLSLTQSSQSSSASEQSLSSASSLDSSSSEIVSSSSSSEFVSSSASSENESI